MYTPEVVPIKISGLLTKIEKMLVPLLNPILAVPHVLPLSVDNNIPPGVPTIIVEPVPAIQFINCSEVRLSATTVDQLFPLSVERHKPEAVPA